MSAPAVTVQAVELVKRFRSGTREQLALEQVSLEVPSGKLSALVGPDGAGKTTLLRMIAGLLKADEGLLKVLGLDVAADPQQVQDLISYMPQKFGLYEDLTIQENLELYADLHGVRAQQREERFSRLLQMMDLTRFRDRLAGQLSGGMKQKLGLACTLVRSPQLLLLDEPTVGVDPLSRRELWSIIEQLIEQENLTVLISTAYMDEAQRCAQVFVLYQGRLIAQGPPAQLCHLAQGLCYGVGPEAGTPARLLQARLLDDNEHIIDAVPEGGMVRFIRSAQVPLQAIPSLAGQASPQALEARLEDGFMVLLRQQVGSVASLDEPAQVPASDGQGDVASGRAVVIEVRDLVRKFGDFTAVASTSFEVLKGEIFGLLGPNGAGKTTTFRMLCGLLPASSGHLEVAGVNLRTARAAARRKIGYVSQKFALYANLSALENLRFFGGAYGLHGAKLKARVALMLEQFDLDEHKHLRSGELPGGYKQRLAMAVALLHEPQILFLDEPTSGIDPLARRAFWRRITALAQSGTTIVITTHFMEEAEYCDRIVIQDAGRLLALGTPEQVRHQGSESLADMNSAFIAVVERARAQASAPVQ
ncbi:ATP-binding cassette domain-containing protein [Pseudomonas sp. 50_B]|uniref:ATP-binding cassette domain-containing protein n=1 Tax=Pseudomonas sp. 50_B TaxID=2813574 RepID=UPI001A9E676B|nr:ATP-binding cassette domain-containing protein [Pseudomonas sp. 50_B]